MTSNPDQAKLIAERIARRLANEAGLPEKKRAIADGFADDGSEHRRARIINFVSPTAPPRTTSSIGERASGKAQTESQAMAPADQFFYPQVAQSPWLAPFSRAVPEPSTPDHNSLHSIRTPQPASHPSQERFDIDEAVVSELVEFFEQEKQCSVDPSGKPCDHCAMCNARGF